MDDLDYETHLDFYKTLFDCRPDNPYGQSKETFKFAENQAQETHFLAVFNPLRDWFINAVSVSSKLKNENAAYYMKYGAGRRLSMIFSAYQTITHVAHPKRTRPLSHEEQTELSKDINVLYMNLRGVLDNFAWCFMYEKTPELVSSINRNDIGLFSAKFRKKCSAFAEIEADIVTHDAWEKEVKDRRDPVANRIPLYVPHTSVTVDEAETHNDLNQQYYESLNALDFEGSDAAFEKMHEVGTFLPYFIHHPKEPCIPIYPTIPTDMAHLIKIGNAIERGLLGGD